MQANLCVDGSQFHFDIDISGIDPREGIDTAAIGLNGATDQGSILFLITGETTFVPLFGPWNNGDGSGDWAAGSFSATLTIQRTAAGSPATFDMFWDGSIDHGGTPLTDSDTLPSAFVVSALVTGNNYAETLTVPISDWSDDYDDHHEHHNNNNDHHHSGADHDDDHDHHDHDHDGSADHDHHHGCPDHDNHHGGPDHDHLSGTAEHAARHRTG